MHDHDIGIVCHLVRQFWPRANWTAAEWSLMTADLAKYRITSDQAIAIVEEVKRTTTYPSKVFSELTTRMRAAHQASFREAAMAPRPAAAADDIPDYYPGGQNMRTAMNLWTGGQCDKVHPDWVPVIKELLKYPGILRKYATAGGKP